MQMLLDKNESTNGIKFFFGDEGQPLSLIRFLAQHLMDLMQTLRGCHHCHLE